MDEGIKLEGGKLTLFRRNGLWQARIYVGDRRYLWRSLKTANQKDAEKAAIRLFHQTEYKLAEGLPVHNRSFDAVITEYVQLRENDNKVGKEAQRGKAIKFTQDEMLRQIKRVSKFWREYAGSKAIEAVDDKVISGYVAWRKDYYHHVIELPKNAKLNPTDKTLQWEMMLGKMIVRYAHDRGYRGNKPLPTATFTPKIKRVRPAPTRADFTSMIAGLETYVKEAKTDRQREIRLLLRDYVLLLGLSGLRVGEVNNLKLRDIEDIVDADGRQNVVFHVRGKTGERASVPFIEARRVIDEIRERRGTGDRDALLFVMPDGGKIITLADQFNAFLKHVQMTHNSKGEKYTLYSLRHFYAVRAIANDMPVFDIARNMGTSVQMIEQYYGQHATARAKARKLGGEYGLPNAGPPSQITLNEEQKQRRAKLQRERRIVKRLGLNLTPKSET